MNRSWKAEGPLVRVASVMASVEPWEVQTLELLPCQLMLERLAEVHLLVVGVVVLGPWGLVEEACSHAPRAGGRLA